jgi:hypothetical protein
VIERCGAGPEGEQKANERRRFICKAFGVDSTEIRIAKEFQDTETILREVIQFNLA